MTTKTRHTFTLSLSKGFTLSLSKGFTMIELLIAITVIAVMITIGTSSYRVSQERQALRSDIETGLEILQNAKKSAIVGDTDCTGPAPDPSIGIKVSFDIGSPIINIQAICKNSTGPIRSVTLKSSTPTNKATYTFRALDGSLSNAAGGILVNLKTPGNLSSTISVSEAGAITYVQTP